MATSFIVLQTIGLPRQKRCLPDHSCATHEDTKHPYIRRLVPVVKYSELLRVIHDRIIHVQIAKDLIRSFHREHVRKA
jgi:hypothetical protein